MFEKLDLGEILQSIRIDQTYELTLSDRKDRDGLQKKIDKIVAKHSIPHVNGEYNRAIGNATKHGSCPIKCTIFIGPRSQMICVITDSGKGFDFLKIIQKYQSGKVYYNHHGKGIKKYATNRHLQVDWENGGKTIILYYNRK